MMVNTWTVQTQKDGSGWWDQGESWEGTVSDDGRGTPCISAIITVILTPTGGLELPVNQTCMSFNPAARLKARTFLRPTAFED